MTLHVCVVTSPYIRTIASNVGQLLARLGITYTVVWVHTPPPGGHTAETFSPSTHPAEWYLIIGTVQVDPLPSRYIAWQVEQVESRHWTPRYARLLQRATYTWHFSQQSLLEKPTPPETSCVVPLPYAANKTCTKTCTRNGKILFYGGLNDRRNKLLQALRGRYGANMIVQHSVWGKERDQAIQDADVIVNLHFYPRASLEMARINEVLRNGRKVVTECGMPMDDFMTRRLYPAHAVHTVPTVKDDLSNIEVLYKAIDKTLENPVMTPPNEIEDTHLSYLQRALVATGLLRVPKYA